MLSTAQKIYIAKIMSRALLGVRAVAGLPAQASVRRHDIVWQLDLREGIDLSIYVLGCFEPSTVKIYHKLLRPGNVVLDIGANIGAHTLPMAALVGDSGRVLAFEPTAYALSKLQINLALNPPLRARVTAEQFMLVENDQQVLKPAIHSSWPLVASGPIDDRHGGRLMTTDGASAVSLDRVVEQRALTRVDFIKIDVDGNELGVLAGAQRTLQKFQPPIVMELAPHVFGECPADFDRLLQLLWDHGYRLVHLLSRKTLPYNPAEVRRGIPTYGSVNVLAVCDRPRPLL